MVVILVNYITTILSLKIMFFAILILNIHYIFFSYGHIVWECHLRMHFSRVCLKNIKKKLFLAGVESPFCLWKCNNAAIPLWKSKTENLSGKQGVQRCEEKQKCFCAFACTHQSKRQESLWTSRTADKNNLRIHQTTCISFTDSRMDRCQTVKNSCTDSGPLLLHKHPSFTFVCVFVWEIRSSQMKCMETHGHDIYFLDTTKKVV